jgi:hypothetical protein
MRALAPAIGFWVLALLSVLGCGGDDGQTFACQFGTDASRYCIETTTSFEGTPDCGGGALATTCERAGTDGGCVHSLTSGGASLGRRSGTTRAPRLRSAARCRTARTWAAPGSSPRLRAEDERARVEGDFVVTVVVPGERFAALAERAAVHLHAQVLARREMRRQRP